MYPSTSSDLERSTPAGIFSIAFRARPASRTTCLSASVYVERLAPIRREKPRRFLPLQVVDYLAVEVPALLLQDAKSEAPLLEVTV